MTLRSALLAALLVVGCIHGNCRAEAGPPMITDDPGTVEKGHAEINLAFTYEDHPKEKLAEAPLLDMNYGLTEHVQLKLETPWDVEQRVGKNPSGLGDSLAGVKWRFLDEDTHHIAVSTYPQIGFRWPGFSSSRDPADKRKLLILPLQLEKTLGPVTVGMDFGYVFRRLEKPQNYIGLVLGHRFTENFELLGEVRDTAGPYFRNGDWIANGGFRFRINSLIAILGSAGTTFRSSNPDPARIISYFALQFTF